MVTMTSLDFSGVSSSSSSSSSSGSLARDQFFFRTIGCSYFEGITEVDVVTFERARLSIFFRHDTEHVFDSAFFPVDSGRVDFCLLCFQSYNHLVGLSKVLRFGWHSQRKQGLIMLCDNKDSRHDRVVAYELEFLGILGFQPGVDWMISNARNLLAEH
jgi:hypothetical protein